jgi:hypothetical protein
MQARYLTGLAEKEQRVALYLDGLQSKPASTTARISANFKKKTPDS